MGSYWSNPVPLVEIKVQKDEEDESVIATVSFCLGFLGVPTPSVQMDFHNPGKAFGEDFGHLETFIANLDKTESTQGLECAMHNGNMGISMTEGELIFSLERFGAEHNGGVTTRLPRQVFGPLLVEKLREFIDSQKQK